MLELYNRLSLASYKSSRSFLLHSPHHPHLLPAPWLLLNTIYFPNFVGEDIWRYVGKLTDAQRSMLDDRFKWKVGIYLFFSVLKGIYLFCPASVFSINLDAFYQVREMEKKKEGRPGEARAALRRSVRENGSVPAFNAWMYMSLYHLQNKLSFLFLASILANFVMLIN